MWDCNLKVALIQKSMDPPKNHKTPFGYSIIFLQAKLRNQRDKTIADKLMYIPNGDTQNYPFCRLQLTNQSKFNKSP